ncbi:MAG: hypothetical protein IKI77_05860 [Oscillospiraceae bacterium]|nr:hypothetical protein [Oscillospiraceae bacterium]
MRTFRYEWKKLCGFRLLWIILLCLLCLNGYVQISHANSRGFTGSEYRGIIHRLNKMEPEKMPDYLQTQMERFGFGAYNRAEFSIELINEMQPAVDQLLQYPDYLANIADQSGQLSALSLWGGKDTFSYRNIQKTPPAYEAVQGITLRLDKSLGIEDALNHSVSDYLGLFLLFLIVSAVMLRDREQGMMPLLFAMPEGRGTLLRVKLGLIALCTVGITLLLFGENLLIGGMMYGLGDLSRPVQCIGSLYTCNLPVSVGTYLVLFFLTKIAGFLVFSMVFAAICAAAHNNLTVYICSGIFVGVSYLLYHFVPALSAWSMFRYLSPAQLVNVNEVFGTYRNINLFGYPFSLKIAAFIAIVLLLTAACAVCALLFIRRKNLQYRNVSLTLLRRRHSRVHGQFYYVCFRSLILQRGIVPVIAVIFAAAVWSSGFVRYLSSDEIYYEKFTTEQAGVLTEDTFAFIKEKQVGYKKLENQIMQLQMSGKANSFALNELYQKMNDRGAFERFRARYNAIRKSDAAGEMFYDSGYARLFGMDGNTDDLQMNLMILIFLCLLLAPFASLDRKTDMVKILYATAAGKHGYWKKLLLYSALCGAAVSLLFNLPYVWHILQKYGTQGLSAPLQSMTMCADDSVIRSVRTQIILLLLVRTAAAAATAMLISLLSAACRSPIPAYIATFSVFVLPAGLALLGVPNMPVIGVNPFLSFNRLVGTATEMYGMYNM